jgi:hypothetical protein
MKGVKSRTRARLADKHLLGGGGACGTQKYKVGLNLILKNYLRKGVVRCHL